MRRHRVVDAPLTRHLSAVAAAAALCLVPAAGGTAQERGSVLGTVRAADSGAPLAGTRVSVLGTAVWAETNGEGRYRLLNVAAGRVQLRVGRPSYVTIVEEVTVRADQASVAEFALPPLGATVAALTVRGRHRPADPADPRAAPAAGAMSLLEWLDHAVPGLVVYRGSGQVGAGLRLQLRGVRSLVAQAPPLVYVDGVRVDVGGGVAGAGVAAPGILDALQPAMIERVEVVRGPEAAVYGLGAGNGVILITTRRGQPRP